MADGIVVEVRDRVGYVTIDRPDRMNALDRAALADLVSAFDAFDADDDVWVAVVTGAGDRAFCAGRDLAEVRRGDLEAAGPIRPMRGPLRNAFEVVYECRKPTIAAVNGWAVGGGMELALACDLRVATESARFAMTEAKRGMGANFGASILPRLVPTAIAYELLYLAEPLSSREARDWGLVNRVFPDEEFRHRAEEFTRTLLERAPLTQRRAKAVIQKGRDLPLQAALRLDAHPDPYRSEDREEGVAAFLEKRPPNWRAR